MKEKKFRAYYLGEFINNCAIVNGCLAIEENPIDDRSICDNDGNWYYSDWSKYYYYPMAKIMQWSGLQDSKGVDIYEGDIVYLAGYGDYEVEFPFIELYEAGMENDIGEILGNIYEGLK